MLYTIGLFQYQSQEDGLLRLTFDQLIKIHLKQDRMVRKVGRLFPVEVNKFYFKANYRRYVLSSIT